MWLTKDVDKDLPRMRKGAVNDTPAVSPVWPCKKVLTGKSKQPGVLVLRCECMTQTTAKPKTRFYSYDPIGEFTSLKEAHDAWERHRDARTH